MSIWKSSLGGVSNQATLNITSGYVITDTDDIGYIFVDTTSGDIPITMPLLENNYDRRIKIVHARGANKIIISANATDANKIFADALDDIWLPVVGDYVHFQASDVASAIFWRSLGEKITAELWLQELAGYGSSDTMIIQLTNTYVDTSNMMTNNHGAYGTAGLEVTIQRSGKYDLDATGHIIAGKGIGFSLNSSQLTTTIFSITRSDILTKTHVSSGIGAQMQACSKTKVFSKGDIIRFHGTGAGSTDDATRLEMGIVYKGK